MREFAERHEYLAAGGFFVLVACAWFWPLLIGHQMGQSHILYSSWPWIADRPADLTVHARSGEGDAATQLGPMLDLARHQLHSGRLPLWNPYIYGGSMPLFANLQSALLYPLTWIGLLLPVTWAWTPGRRTWCRCHWHRSRPCRCRRRGPALRPRFRWIRRRGGLASGRT